MTAHPANDETLKLSLDDAVRRGLENNLGLKEAESGEKQFQGEKNEALQEFLPTIGVRGSTGVYQHNLAALGFKRSVLEDFPQLPADFSLITRNDLTQGLVTYKQTLFSGPVIAGWKAAGAAQRSAYFAKMSARGEVVQQVATAYLHVIADASEVDNATALEAADKLLFENARAAHEAGTLANLDEVRAKVQLQAQQQTLILAQ
ncbi:MAG TPA: TolC family protein, partial [Candidatus Angelobacter sp.]|nr:TolC family protein [Candidatus Angelobacter sp.]